VDFPSFCVRESSWPVKLIQTSAQPSLPHVHCRVLPQFNSVIPIPLPISVLAAGGVSRPAYWAPASLIRPTPKKTPVA